MSEYKSNLINPFSYWVIPDKLAAGEYPGNQYSLRGYTTVMTLVHSFRGFIKSGGNFWNSTDNKINSLIESGIRSFVDLTEDNERPSYRSKLHKIRRENSISCNYKRFPIKDKSVPSENLLRDMIEYVNSEIDSGRPVYIHCFRGLGRTGLVVGCYMKQSDVEIGNVFELIKNLRLGLAGDFRKSPETAIQNDFLMGW